MMNEQRIGIHTEGAALTSLGNLVQESRTTVECFKNETASLRCITLTAEFTAKSPATGQCISYRAVISYRPDVWLVERQSLACYLKHFENEVMFTEVLADRMYTDLCAMIEPFTCQVELTQNVKEGVGITVTAGSLL